jgi:hypothetical protein
VRAEHDHVVVVAAGRLGDDVEGVGVGGGLLDDERRVLGSAAISAWPSSRVTPTEGM